MAETVGEGFSRNPAWIQASKQFDLGKWTLTQLQSRIPGVNFTPWVQRPGQPRVFLDFSQTLDEINATTSREGGLWTDPKTGRPEMREVPGSEFELDVELVLLAMGFVHPIHEGMLQELGMELDARGNVACDDKKMTSVDGVFVAGDMTRGQSLVVWAIAEGREAARSVDLYLMGVTQLPHSEFLK